MFTHCFQAQFGLLVHDSQTQSLQFGIQLGALVRNKQEVLGWKDEDFRALIQDVKTRWNSTLDMLERFHYLQEPVKKIIDDE